MQKILFFFCILYILFQQCISQNQCFVPTIGTMLIFFPNSQTTRIKIPDVQQLNCKGGNGCKYSNKINNIQCSCDGFDENNNPQWKCKSDLPNYLKFKQVSVLCETCSIYSNNEFITGSCGLYYNLNYSSTDKFDNQITHNFALGIILFFAIVIFIFLIGTLLNTCFKNLQKYNYQQMPQQKVTFREMESNFSEPCTYIYHSYQTENDDKFFSNISVKKKSHNSTHNKNAKNVSFGFEITSQKNKKLNILNV